eukprot:GDKH01013006.1.p2 GENE.GDKH01013006.1~~GDKH01013006.1.p2  ORF type:complete len:74 (-),score=4.15 GDKH01013006.1:124-345(-)
MQDSERQAVPTHSDVSIQKSSSALRVHPPHLNAVVAHQIAIVGTQALVKRENSLFIALGILVACHHVLLESFA